jgi:hypothetical protein
MPTYEDLKKFVEKAISSGKTPSNKDVVRVLKDFEVESGFVIINPCVLIEEPEKKFETLLITEKENPETCYGRRNLRIILVVSRVNGNGAFSHFIDAAIARGYIPNVIFPTMEMAKILNRWGWNKSVVNGEDVWKPDNKWLKKRMQKATDNKIIFLPDFSGEN